MNSYFKIFTAAIVILIIVIGVLCGVVLIIETEQEITELRQIHVVFSHGVRTPTIEETEAFPLIINQNEHYYPHGHNALTNKGKLTMFELGKQIRNLYDDFLPKLYDSRRFLMYTIDTDISKTSALVVQTGIWCVENNETWNLHQWQPIPYTTMEKSKDYLSFENNCPQYNVEKQKIMSDLFEKSLLPYKEIFQLTGMYTGTHITDSSQILQLKNLITAQKSYGYTIPKWYKDMEYLIRNMTHLQYKFMFHNSILQRLSSGFLLQEITEGYKYIDNDDSNSKMIMYSGNINNIAAILAVTDNLDVYPEAASAIIIEIHKLISTNEYGYKLLYYDNELKLHELEISDCGNFCNSKNFEKTMHNIFGEDYESECQIHQSEES